LDGALRAVEGLAHVELVSFQLEVHLALGTAFHPLPPPRDDVARELAQRLSSRAESYQTPNAGVRELRRDLAGAVRAGERDERRLPDVLLEVLPGEHGVAGDVQDVVDDLEGQAEVLG